MRAVVLFTVDVGAAGAGVDTTGGGVTCCGVATAATGVPKSAQQVHSTCNEVCDVSVHPNGVRMILPGQLGSV